MAKEQLANLKPAEIAQLKELGIRFEPTENGVRVHGSAKAVARLKGGEAGKIVRTALDRAPVMIDGATQYLDTQPNSDQAYQVDHGGVTFAHDSAGFGDIESRWLTVGHSGAIRFLTRGDETYLYAGGTERIDALGVTVSYGERETFVDDVVVTGSRAQASMWDGARALFVGGFVQTVGTATTQTAVRTGLPIVTTTALGSETAAAGSAGLPVVASGVALRRQMGLFEYATQGGHLTPMLNMQYDVPLTITGSGLGGRVLTDQQQGFGVITRNREEAKRAAEMQLQGRSSNEINAALAQMRGPNSRAVGGAVGNGPVSLADTGYELQNFRFTDAMTDRQYTTLIRGVRQDGFTDPVIKYTLINETPYVLVGNNRVMAARDLGRLDELRFQRVELPLAGTNWNTAQDVLNVGYVRQPMYRGR